MPHARSPIRRCRPWGARLACIGALATMGAFAQIPVVLPQKVLRYSMEVAETGFDPAQVPDAYSREIIDNIIEPPLRYRRAVCTGNEKLNIGYAVAMYAS